MVIGIVSGSRADYGLLEPLAKVIELDPTVGHYFVGIENPMDSDNPQAISLAMGKTIAEVGSALSKGLMDVVIVLGDRWEILAVTIAAYIARIPIAHIHGGETTKGSYDDGFRYAISHMATWHFPAAEPYAEKLRQIGIAPDKIWMHGALGADGLTKKMRDPLKVEDLLTVIYHPATAGDEDVGELLAALKDRPERKVVIKGGVDVNSLDIWTAITGFTMAHGGELVENLPRGEYLKLLARSKAIVGNSSSGIVEAPAMGVPTINVGSRQEGRLMADSILNCACKRKDIFAAFAALDSICALRQYANPAYDLSRPLPYRGGNVAQKIWGSLKQVVLENA